MAKTIRDGLILRSLGEGVDSDRENFAAFLYAGFENEGDWREARTTAWVNDLMNTHPLMSLDNFWVVVDPTKNDKIVSGLLMIPQIWRYEDIEIPVGRPELIATLPEYRRRGLIRELMNTCHEYSRQQGHLLNGITGIPYYYRQFGYAMAVYLGQRVWMPLFTIPELVKGENPCYALRKATYQDIPALIAIDDYNSKWPLLYVQRDEIMWRYEIDGRNPNSYMEFDIFVLVDADNTVVGYLSLTPIREDSAHLGVIHYAIGEKVSYLETFDAVITGLKAYVLSKNESIAVMTFPVDLHPSLLASMRFIHGVDVADRSYSWYLRVPDHVAFIKRIASVLERRLEGSGAQGYTGHLCISFHNFGYLTIKFEQGKITDVHDREVPECARANAQFPFNTWLNIVFGFHSHDDLHNVLPDARISRDAAVLLDILFPKKPSSIYAIG